MKIINQSIQAVLLMLASMAGFSAMNIVIRILSHDMPSTQMVLLRNITSLGLVVIWDMVFHRRLPVFPTMRMKGHFWRASVGIVAMELWFHAVTLLPLTLATALSFTTPVFSTVFAIFFLHEKVVLPQWVAIALGIIGVLVILRPGMGEVGGDALFVIASSAMMAVAGVMVKSLTSTEPPETIVFYMALFMIPWSVPPAMLHWQAVSAYQWWLVILVAFFSTASHLLIARAYIRADMVMLMPFDFSRLVFTALFAYFLFGETLDAPTLCGSLIIVASTVYIARKETRLQQHKMLQRLSLSE